MTYLTLIEPGMATGIQDLGRMGFQSQGYCISGAMDQDAMRWANLLLGSPQFQAVLETGAAPISFRLSHATSLCVTGAMRPLSINHHPASLWQSHNVSANSLIHLGPAVSGNFSYIALAGGFSLTPCLGSMSYSFKEKIGATSRLIAASQLEYQRQQTSTMALLDSAIPDYQRPLTLDFMPHSQWHELPRLQQARFCHLGFTLSGSINRMGIALKGPHIPAPSPGIRSEGNGPGTIQLPPHGKPIVLMREHQTIGGYAKLGTLTQAAISQLSQAGAHTQINFHPVDRATAQALGVLHHHSFST